MRIAIDYNAALRQVAGIGRYTRGLVRALAELRSGDELVLFYAARDLPRSPSGLDALLELQAANLKVTSVPIPLSERWLTILWQRARVPMPVEYWTGRIDLLHAPDFVLPPARTRRTLLTVHDLTFRIHPETAHTRLRRYLDAAVPRSLDRALHVLADSHSTAADLQELMAVPREKITVLYPGIGPQFRRVEDPEVLERVRARYNLPPRFLFHIGTIEPRKNLERLIEVYRRLRDEQAAGGGQPSLGLVLAGKPGWLSEPILRAARQTPGVVLPGPVADDDLPALYSLAAVLVYPTLYEGFGFPPLEAMACGTPVVMSNTSSLPELAGDTALLVEPRDASALAAALRRLLADQQAAEAARAAGPRQAARFTWARAAQQLLELYYSLPAQPGTQPTITRPGE